MTTTPSRGTSLAPWLDVPDGPLALGFYTAAFGAREVYRFVASGSFVVRLSVDGAEFWITGNEATSSNAPTKQTPGGLGGGNVRMILTVADPDAMFARALAAGATEVHPVGDAHGWRLGRLIDPFGLHWEIGRETNRA